MCKLLGEAIGGSYWGNLLWEAIKGSYWGQLLGEAIGEEIGGSY